MILFAVLSLSLISFISADYASNYVYAGNGVIVYPGYILKQVCHPFMPCGVERINIPSSNNRNNGNENIPEESRDGDVLYDELSSPGFSRVIADQRSATYDPLYKNRNMNYNQNYNTNVVVYTVPKQYNSPPQVKHFADTYNTQNNFDSYGNWIGDNRYNNYNNRNYPQQNSRVMVVYG